LKRDSWLIRGSFSRRNAAVHFVFTKLNRYGTGGNEVIKSARYPSCVRAYCHMYFISVPQKRYECKYYARECYKASGNKTERVE